MNDLVEKALKLARDKESATSSALVVRPLDLMFDLGNMLTWSENEIEIEKLVSSNDEVKEEYLLNMAREDALVLYNALWGLPNKCKEEPDVAELPPPSYDLPREKPIPKPRPPTKWEQYAKEKGIEKKKKTRLVWDDVVKNWIPRYGYKKAQAEEEKNWMMEYKGGENSNVDPFQKAIEEKRERVAKNELHRLRNIAKAKKVNLPGVGLAPIAPKGSNVTNSQDLQKAADLAKKSTASLGKFQEKLPTAMEKSVKPRGQKRKFDPLIQAPNVEKSKSLAILDKIVSKQSKLDVTKAVGKQFQAEERVREAEKKNFTGKKGRRSNNKGAKKGGLKRNRKPLGQKSKLKRK